MARRWFSSSFWWPELIASYMTPGWIPSSLSWEWSRQRFLQWPGSLLSLPIVDEVIWSLVTAFESVALVSMFCFFFLFCGCTV